MKGFLTNEEANYQDLFVAKIQGLKKPPQKGVEITKPLRQKTRKQRRRK